MREFLDWRQRRKELKGILRLLDLETYRHRKQLNAYKNTPTWITDAPVDTLRFSAWDKSNTRLSQLLRDDTEFADIAKYYENLRAVDEFRRSSEDTESWRQERVGLLLPTLFELHDLTRRHIKRNVPEASLGTPLDTLQNKNKDLPG
ncbi:MAG: hypothetical protein CYG60_00200 [Actinobacteria bacterium]|nr:MAG: hypothetical protein CYG60_00200 [Actinomycetota bacterium]